MNLTTRGRWLRIGLLVGVLVVADVVTDVVAGAGTVRAARADLGFQAVGGTVDPPCGVLLPHQRCQCPAQTQLMGDPLLQCIVELHLTAPSPQPLVLRWRTVDGTARAGVDYVGVPLAGTPLPAGANAATVRVQLLPRPPSAPPTWFAVEFIDVSR
jgi:hypothetical protein